MLDEIPLPVQNPWKRNVRLADLGFLDDQGHAVAVTMDGDVWKLSGLQGDLSEVTWRRFASGLHEPMSIVVRDGTPFVFDRSGIWKLVDSNDDGECDRYEMFCNLFAQTGETREFPNSMELGPDGSFYIAKGGQEETTRGKHNGTVLRVAPDGKSFEVIGYGLRQPFIGVNPTTGLVTASDQQGNYVPSTPLHLIRDRQFYGFLPGIAEPEKYPEPIAEPLAWIPHPVNSSGATQVWASDERLGPIFGELIHVGYNRPELFRVIMNERFERPQAAVMSFVRGFDFGPLNAKVNPADGQLYVTGFQIWGTTAKALSGLARVRHTGKPRVLVTELTPMDQGVLLKFNAELDPKLATDPANYSAERWNYHRTPKYGSPHLMPNGETGQEWMTASSAYLSEDGRSVFVGFPDMKAGVHQMRVGWGVESADGLPAQNAAYLSPWELATFDAAAEGFGDIKVDLTPRKAAATEAMVATAAEGERLYQMFGCMACHSIDGTLQGKVGPSWKALFGSERDIAKTGKVTADEAYLKESILNPSAKVVKGFEKFDSGNADLRGHPQRVPDRVADSLHQEFEVGGTHTPRSIRKSSMTKPLPMSVQRSSTKWNPCRR
jgi:mono/diheme cytochrome c family protein